MEPRLLNISKTLTQAAIDAYNGRATMYQISTVHNSVRKVYEELLIGVRNKSAPWSLAKNVAKIAVISYWKDSRMVISDHKVQTLEEESLFRRAVLATNATLKRMMKETNYQRRLARLHSF